MQRIYPWKYGESRHIINEIYDRIIDDIMYARGNRILILCSAGGESTFEIARRLESRGLLGYEIIGLELDEDLVKISMDKLRNLVFRGRIDFKKASKDKILFPDKYFDALISEFIIYPSPQPTNIGQIEMARVLRDGGIVVLTDIIASEDDELFEKLGITYYCKASIDDFRKWMEDAGFKDVVIDDISNIVKKAWEARLKSVSDQKCKDTIVTFINNMLGVNLRYVYIRGIKYD